MFSSIALAPINHIILSESWAIKLLQSHIGKTVKISILPLINIAFTVQESGEISIAHNKDKIDTTATLTFSILSRLLIQDEEAYSEISISGDRAFAEELFYIGKNIRWDLEQDLSQIMGDILAYRIVQTGNEVKNWCKGTSQNLNKAIEEYWLEEQPLLVRSSNSKEFVEEVNKLWKETEQLEIRLEKIGK